MPPKGDAFDYFSEGRTAEELRALIEARRAEGGGRRAKGRRPTTDEGRTTDDRPPFPVPQPLTPNPRPLTPDLLRALVEAAKAVRPPKDEPPSSGLRPSPFPLPPSSFVLVKLAEVAPERVRWLWPGRIPLGKLTIVDGDPGLGKSALTTDLAARTSRGAAMPDGTTGDLDGPAGVVLLSAEDGLADTIRPRLDAAGADLQRVVALTLVKDESGERLPTLADLPALETTIRQVQARLLVVDPLMAYFDGGTNSSQDQDVRRVLAPLAKLAERTGVAVVVVRHLTKASGANPLYRGGGSIGIIGAARSSLLVAKDPDDETGARRVLASTKANLAAAPASLAYHLEPAPNDSIRVVWDGPTAHTAAQLLAQPTAPDERPAFTEATAFLAAALAAGPRPAEEVQREARRAGILEVTLRRAKTALGVEARRQGFGRDGKWFWSLPARESTLDDHPRHR